MISRNSKVINENWKWTANCARVEVDSDDYLGNWLGVTAVFGCLSSFCTSSVLQSSNHMKPDFRGWCARSSWPPPSSFWLPPWQRQWWCPGWENHAVQGFISFVICSSSPLNGSPAHPLIESQTATMTMMTMIWKTMTRQWLSKNNFSNHLNSSQVYIYIYIRHKFGWCMVPHVAHKSSRYTLLTCATHIGKASSTYMKLS